MSRVASEPGRHSRPGAGPPGEPGYLGRGLSMSREAPAAQGLPERSSFAAGLVRRLMRAAGSPPARVRLWTGETVLDGGPAPIAEIEFRSFGALLATLRDPAYGFPAGYADGTIGCSGDLTRLLSWVYRALAARRAPGSGRALRRRRERVGAHTLVESSDNVHSHYDLGNDFFRLWLDPTLSYTCAYYPGEATTLAEAQVAKMHHVARKLWLSPGESVIEAGCGWGGLALTLARDYGVHVRAFNVSREQIEYARSAAGREGLAGRVEFIEDDWRNVTGRCDAFVSIGMLEHVGIAHYAELGRLVSRSLKPLGRGLIHSIGRSAAWPVNRWIRERIFPGGEVPSIAEMMTIFAPDELAVLDVENLRLHYARTLEDWLQAFEQHAAEVGRMFDERFLRTWRMYLAGSCAAFHTGELQLFQVLFAPRGNDALPMTRERLHLGKL